MFCCIRDALRSCIFSDREGEEIEPLIKKPQIDKKQDKLNQALQNYCKKRNFRTITFEVTFPETRSCMLRVPGLVRELFSKVFYPEEQIVNALVYVRQTENQLPDLECELSDRYKVYAETPEYSKKRANKVVKRVLKDVNDRTSRKLSARSPLN